MIIYKEAIIKRGERQQETLGKPKTGMGRKDNHNISLGSSVSNDKNHKILGPFTYITENS